MTPRPRITHVAVRFNGQIYSLPPPNRHHDVIWEIARVTNASTVRAGGDNQGFLDESGRYLTRKEALLVALENNQVKDASQIRGRSLFSEDLW